MSSILELAKQINKEYKNNTIIRKSNIVPAYRRLPSGALGMDYPLFGGLPYGRVCVYSGKQHSGKTCAACLELAAYQRDNPDKICLYVDAEHSLDVRFQTMMNGIDQDRLLIFSPPVGMAGESILAEILRLQTESDDIGLIVLDSIPALRTTQDLKNDFTKDTGKQGSIAKSLHKFLTEIVPSIEEKQNILILINQVRIKEVMYNGAPVYSEPGGDAPRFYSSVSVRFGTRAFLKGDQEVTGENNGDGATGFRLKFQITKNKTAPCNRGGGFISYDYVNGVNTIKDMLEIALTFDFIHRVNNVTYELIDLDTGEVYSDEEGNILRGKKQYLIDYIKSHDDFRQKYFAMLNKAISSSNTLINDAHLVDDKALAEIESEENSVELAIKEEYDNTKGISE